MPQSFHVNNHLTPKNVPLLSFSKKNDTRNGYTKNLFEGENDEKSLFFKLLLSQNDNVVAKY